MRSLSLARSRSAPISLAPSTARSLSHPVLLVAATQQQQRPTEQATTTMTRTPAHTRTPLLLLALFCRVCLPFLSQVFECHRMCFQIQTVAHSKRTRSACLTVNYQRNTYLPRSPKQLIAFELSLKTRSCALVCFERSMRIIYCV